jgi:hypothetical protein
MFVCFVGGANSEESMHLVIDLGEWIITGALFLFLLFFFSMSVIFEFS